MAARATWKGFLRLGLVNIPIKVFSATESSGSIGFNELHAECQTRIQRKRWCPTCEREVAYNELVKGYEFEKGRYVVVSGEEIDAVRPESTRIIDLAQFADESALDLMYVDRTYYLAPDGKKPNDAFAVMREAMHGKVGIGKVAMHGREYVVAVRPKGRGLVMHTLYRADEMQTLDAVEELNTVRQNVRPEELKLAKQVIQTFDAPLDLTTFRDEYVEGLQNVIEAKIQGRDIVAPSAPDVRPAANVMDALRQSLEVVSRGKKKPAKATARPRAAKRQKAS
jgi:DNA end-binding protein Ku